MNAPAYRTLAFLFTDVEGSTRVWEQEPDAMRAALARHDEILREAIEAVGGQVVKTMGDGFMAAFGSAGDGLAACLAAQLALGSESWPVSAPLRVRMGLHVGEATGDGQDYHGQAVNRAARIMAAGHGGQVLLSAPTAALVIDRLPPAASLRDLGEHHLRDMARPERIFQLVHPDLRDAFPPIGTEHVPRRSLPAEPSAFIGRAADVANVVRRVNGDGVRLLTLTGPGGIGKTRLALRAGAEMAEAFADGVVFVDLSAARDTAAVLTAIARELELDDTSGAALSEQLRRSIGERHLLIILDNLEQVTSAAPALGQLQRDCPHLVLLVTSREALHLRNEHLYPVAPMALPGVAERVTSMRDIESYEAVQLFIERAQAVRPGFRVRDADAPVLAEICRRLEGLPLAIELATARLRVFSLEALRDRLGSRLQALGGGARDLPERQQTLRATIDWSYQLLAPAERQLLGVMACFAGADVEAVERVAEVLRPVLPDIEPIDGLASLVEKSLLRQLEQEGPTPRFEMLEAVREFALEQLEQDSDVSAAVRRAHAAHYADWADRRATEIEGPHRDEALSSLAAELENIRLAWRTSLEGRDLECLDQLLESLRPLADAKGWYRELSERISDVLNVIEALPDTPEHRLQAIRLRSDQARALTAIHGYTPEVEAAYERLLASVDAADVPQVYPILRGLASLYSFRAESSKGAEIGRQILRLGEQQGDVLMQVDGHLFIGTGLSFSGRLADGMPDLEAGLRLMERGAGAAITLRLRNDPRVAILTAMSLLTRWQGQLDRSLGCSRRAVALAEELGHPSTLGYAVFHAALLRLWRGEPDEARVLAVRVVEIADEHDLSIWHAVGTVVMGAAAIDLGHHGEGMSWIGDGLEQYRGLHTPPVFWPFLLQLQAESCRRTGRFTDGLRLIGEAVAIAGHEPDLYIVRGDLLEASGAHPEAETAWQDGVEAARRWGAHWSELRAGLRLYRATSADADGHAARRAALATALDALPGDIDAPEIAEARRLIEPR